MEVGGIGFVIDGFGSMGLVEGLVHEIGGLGRRRWAALGRCMVVQALWEDKDITVVDVLRRSRQGLMFVEA